MFNRFDSVLKLTPDLFLGYIFLEFSKHADAIEAIKGTNNYKLDKNHTFSVNLFSDFEKFENISDEWEPPKEEPYANQGDRKSFLLNESAHDQYSIVYHGGDKVGVFRNALPEAVQEEVRDRWTESYIRFVLFMFYLQSQCGIFFFCHSNFIYVKSMLARKIVMFPRCG